MDQQAKQRIALYQQYTAVYGDLAITGQYAVGDRVLFDGGQVGEVVWKYHDANGLTYVLDDNTGFPEEVQARDIERRA